MKIGVNGRFRAARLAGVQRVAHELTRELAQRAETVLLLPADAPEPEWFGGAIARGAKRGHIFEQIELNTLARAAGCDVVLHPANTAPVNGGPHIVIAHDVLPLTNPEWFTRKYVWWQRQVVRRALRNAAHVCTCTMWSAEQISVSCGIPAERISVIPQGIEPFSAPASDRDVTATLAQLGIERPYVLATGWGDPRKNIAFLLPVIAALRASVDVTLVVLGAHQPRVHRAAHLDLPRWVRRVPGVSDEQLRALYTGALALCFPSLAEGYGRPPLEALACGTQALVADYAAAREVLGAAMELLPLDVALWTDRLLALLRHDAAPAHAEDVVVGMSWGNAADAVLQIAARVINSDAVVAA